MEMNTRLDLLQLIPNEGSFVEVGTRSGDFAVEISKARPDIKLFCVDNWLPPFERHYEEALKNIGDKAIILKLSSLDASKTIYIQQVDMVYIDADHTYQSVFDDLNSWWPRIRKGGYLAGHDFESKAVGDGWHTAIEVEAAVTHWLSDKPELKLHVIKESAPSFFIKKP